MMKWAATHLKLRDSIDEIINRRTEECYVEKDLGEWGVIFHTQTQTPTPLTPKELHTLILQHC